MELWSLSLNQLKDGLDKGDFSSEDIVCSLFSRIETADPLVRGFVRTQKDKALLTARHADQTRFADAPHLCGIPFAVKDNICTDGILTTCASRILHNFVPPYDAHVIEKLNGEGAVLLGKTNMDEFAMGSSTENSCYFDTHNPHDLDRVPGGSSGGSAAAVASGMAPFALGSDTGGSVRQPASLCGIFGFKPSYGMISRYGLIAFGSSLDQIGIFARTALDVATVMDAISGYDRRDSTSAGAASGKPDYAASLSQSVRGLKIGLPKEYFEAGIDIEVRAIVEKAAGVFESLGANVEPCSLPRAPYALPTYYLLACAEASSNLARYDGVRYGLRAENPEDWEDMMVRTRSEGFGAEVKRRIMLGTFVLSAGYYDAYYKKAQQARTLIRRDYAEAFTKYDLLLTPTSPTTAWKLGENAEPLSLYAADMCTVSLNIASLPGLSVPCGKDATGLPVGMQLVGPWGGDAKVLSAGYAYEKASGLCVRPVLGGAK
jgi:aspartyl-tRNA(Asn)/glutamyl-tRNA(Gln) amidotransferase subunit A